MKFSIKDFFNKCDQVSCGFGRIYLFKHMLKTSDGTSQI